MFKSHYTIAKKVFSTLMCFKVLKFAEEIGEGS